MKIDSDQLQVREANFVKLVGINMVEIIDFDMKVKGEAFERNGIEVVYPKAVEGLLEFLHRCKADD